MTAACVLGGVLLVAAGWTVTGAFVLGVALGAGLASLGSGATATGRRDTGRSDAHDTASAALVETLAGAIDTKHDPSGRRLHRRRSWAVALAEASRLPSADVEALRTAALLIDVGQLAVPAHILSKPGPLSVEEFHKIRIHPQVSADLIAGLPLPDAVAAFVRAHHERWDGKGYPEGLQQDAIPVGARVLAVVDHYDALVSDRPYRERLTGEAAMAVLREEAGRSLDPQLVDRFIALLPTLDGAAREVPTGSSLVSIVSAHREDAALFEISQGISAGLGVDGTARLLARELRRVIPYSSVALYLYDSASRAFTAVFAEGFDAELLSAVRVGVDAGVFGQAVRDKRAVANVDPQAYIAGTTHETTRLRSSIVCPLLGERNDLVGALAVYHVTPECYTADECRLLEMVARQAGPALSHALQLSRAQAEALTDPLTDLPNTRFLWMHLTQELARAGRQASRLALLLLDVDDFKSLNDRDGHQVGDAALRELATVLRQAVRPYDVCARYGGDEFVVVLADCRRKEAEERLRDLQARIAAHTMRLPDGRTFSVTVSIGAAVFPADGESAEALLATADVHMYQDKQRPRVRRDTDGPGPFPVLPPPPHHTM